MRFLWQHVPEDQPKMQGSAEKAAELSKYPNLDQFKQDVINFGEKKPDSDRFGIKVNDLDRRWNSPLVSAQEKAVREIRTAGITPKEDEENPFRRYTLLASRFLKTDSDGNFVFQTNNNDLALNRIGAGHLLPPIVEEIEVKNNEGQVISKRAVRKIKEGRVGYFDAETDEYIAIFENYRIQPVKTLNLQNPSDRAKLERSLLAERIALFNPNAPTGPSSTLRVKSEPISSRQGVNQNLSALQRRINENSGIQENQTISDVSGYASIDSMAGMEIEDENTEGRLDIAQRALSYVGKSHPELRERDTEGGKLACAKFVSMVLKEMKEADQIILGVMPLIEHLKQKGWREVSGEAKPGDMVVWEPDYASGGSHYHATIALNERKVVGNSSELKQIVSTPINGKNGNRKIYKILRGPRGESVTYGQTFASREKQTKTDDLQKILQKHPDWDRDLEEGMQAYGIPLNLKSLFYTIMKIESDFNPQARPMKGGKLLSSAFGLAQTVHKTWDSIQAGMKKKGIMPPDLNFKNGKQPPKWQIIGLVAHVFDLSRQIGVPLSNNPEDFAKIYLAYHDGVGGYLKGIKPWIDANNGKIVDIPDDATNEQYMAYGFQRARGPNGTNGLFRYALGNAQRILPAYQKIIEENSGRSASTESLNEDQNSPPVTNPTAIQNPEDSRSEIDNPRTENNEENDGEDIIFMESNPRPYPKGLEIPEELKGREAVDKRHLNFEQARQIEQGIIARIMPKLPEGAKPYKTGNISRKAMEILGRNLPSGTVLAKNIDGKKVYFARMPHIEYKKDDQGNNVLTGKGLHDGVTVFKV